MVLSWALPSTYRRFHDNQIESDDSQNWLFDRLVQIMIPGPGTWEEHTIRDSKQTLGWLSL